MQVRIVCTLPAERFPWPALSTTVAFWQTGHSTPSGGIAPIPYLIGVNLFIDIKNVQQFSKQYKCLLSIKHLQQQRCIIFVEFIIRKAFKVQRTAIFQLLHLYYGALHLLLYHFYIYNSPIYMDVNLPKVNIHKYTRAQLCIQYWTTI